MQDPAWASAPPVRQPQSAPAWASAPAVRQDPPRQQARPQPAPRPRAQPFPGDPRAEIERIAPGVNVTSVRRDPERNRAVGGSPNSYHLRGQGMDLTPPPGMSMADLERSVRESGLPFAEIINEGDHVHVAWEGQGYGAGNGYEVASSTYTNETPEQLRAQGYEPDPNQPGTWARTIGTVERPQPLPGPAPLEESDPGYAAALRQEQEKQGQFGYGDVGFMDQATAPINDEVAWLIGLLSQGGANLGRTLTGQENEIGALDRARAMRQMSLEAQDQFERENPGQAVAGAIMSAATMGPARGAGILPRLGETAGGRIAQAAGVSGAFGAAEGDGYLGRVGSGAVSAAIGGATGGLLEGGGAIVNRAVTGQARRAAGVPAGRTPEVRVGETVSRALERDAITPEAYLAALDDAAPGQLPFERAGENLVGLAEVAAQAPGRARGLLTSNLQARSDEATNRVADRLGEAFGAQGNSIQTIRARVKARSDAADAGMAQFGDRPVALDDNAVQALRQGLASRAVREEATNAAAELSPEGAAAANRLFGLADEVVDNPAAARLTIREAQDVSYALKEAADRAYRGGFNARGKALKNLSDAIRGAARQDPDYAKWLQDFGDASQVIDALRKGRAIFSPATEKNAMSAAELRETWADLSEAARDNLRLGVGEALLDRVRSQGGVTAMRRLLKDREIADRVRIAFGSDEAFERFMRAASDEVGMQNITNQVLGGSATGRRVAGAADLNAQEGFDPAEAAGLLEGGITGLTAKAARAALKALPKKDRSILGDATTNDILGRALNDPEAMRGLLTMVRRREAIGQRASRPRLGLLAPGAVAGGQERARGLLTTTP